MKISVQRNVYVQPEYKVYQVKLQQVIAQSDTAATENLVEEDYEWA